MTNHNIINPEYQAQLATMHGQGRFVRGSKLLKSVKPFLNEYQPLSLLDFGCGQGGLMSSIQENFANIKVSGYDPGNAEHDTIPNESFDAVISADVFEHIEPEHLDATLQTINDLMIRCGWFRIACYPAKKILLDGRNAHLIVQSPEWWRSKILANMQVKIVHEEISFVNKNHKWPGIVGHNYDLVVVK